MRKQYMDFVPAKSRSKSADVVAPSKGSKAVGGGTRAVKTTRTTGIEEPVRPAKVVRSAKPVAFTGEVELRLGVVEDLAPKFVKTDVPKRPLSQASHFRAKQGSATAAKAKKVGGRNSTKSVEKPVENSKKKGVKTAYQTPKTPFINQGKVQKRPLSKNVYAKKIEVPKEVPKGPVTIISKPEKQAHAGMIIAIILTIILGAAAGTVAFLLLPK